MNKQIVMQPESVRFMPVTESSYPFGMAARQNEPIDLAAYGYVEEEYIIGGKSNVYTWPQWQQYPDIRTKDAPYVTRIMVRKPKNPEKFSGNVFVELNNWAHFYDRPIAGWIQCAPYFLESGDVWVGITVRARCLESLRTFDPERYGDLSFANPLPENERGQQIFDYDKTDPDTENGLIWDMISQVGVLMRGETPESPLYNYDVKAIMGCGATGGDLSAYIAAVHPISCRKNLKPVYDGFCIFMTGAPGSLNQEEDKLSPLDVRCRIYSEVPVIHVNTTDDILGIGHHPDWAAMQRRPDSDSPGAQFRTYEISGTGRLNQYLLKYSPCKEDVERSGRALRNTRGFQGDLPEKEFPLRYILCATYDNLKRWVREGIAPPKGEPICVKGVFPDLEYVVDEDGIPCGGVRLPCVEVPTAYMTPGTSDVPAVCFTKEQLRERYHTKEAYMDKLLGSVYRCLNERWLLPNHAKEIVLEAMQLDF